MFPQKLSQKLLSLTATTALGITALTGVSILPAQAVQLQTFKISGTFGDESFSNSLYLKQTLANGYFQGSYTIDVDQLPTNDYVSFTDWNVSIFQSSGKLWGGFGPNTDLPVSYSSGGVSNFNGDTKIDFIGYRDPRMYLYVDKDFQGTSSGRAVDMGFSAPVYGEFGSYYDGETNRIYVTSFRSEPLSPVNPPVTTTVPESSTLAGVLVTFLMGWLIKHKQKVIQLG
ncbi:MAG TPA: hypothetical protein VK184_23295 [Nostocaceae cyanobacterium]|nr:hypothetical protein [Nostocaceae cyanobacterium]